MTPLLDERPRGWDDELAAAASSARSGMFSPPGLHLIFTPAASRRPGVPRSNPLTPGPPGNQRGGRQQGWFRPGWRGGRHRQQSPQRLELVLRRISAQHPRARPCLRRNMHPHLLGPEAPPPAGISPAHHAHEPAAPVREPTPPFFTPSMSVSRPAGVDADVVKGAE